MKLLSAPEMHWLDKQTIQQEPVSSLDLMERAAKKIFDQILIDFKAHNEFIVICGKGNNGGDGLVISRLLLSTGKCVVTVIPSEVTHASDEFTTNLERLTKTEGHFITSEINQIVTGENPICIDALFGNGFHPPLKEPYIALISWMNEKFTQIVSIDINSGLPSDLNVFHELDMNRVVKSTLTYCIGSPKLSLLFPETGWVCDMFKTIDIGHHAVSRDAIQTPYFYMTDAEILRLLPVRSRFAYKNTFGHVLAMAGSKGKSGAAYLCGKAAMETGAGLVSYHTCSYTADTLQIAFPEAMTLPNESGDTVINVPSELSRFSVLAIGPGLGTSSETVTAIKETLKNFDGPVVADADALNACSIGGDWTWTPGTIITPHPGEFDRLTQQHKDGYTRFLSQMEYSKKHQIIVVLKGANTSISLPDGRVYFNLTGTAAMAKAGSGDVLTGMIAAFLAQGLSPENAAIAGVYLHGRSGELAAASKGPYSVIASDLIGYIHQSILTLNTIK